MRKDRARRVSRILYNKRMGLVLLILTNLAFPFAALGVAVGFLLSSRRKLLSHLWAELRERFGLEKPDSLPRQAIWLHCASVGEVNSVKGLVSALKKYYNKRILISTSTQAGKEAALKNPDVSAAVLAPLDFYPSCARFVRVIQPYRLFVIEREIWPNMLEAARRAAVPYAIVNGRISEKSARAYRWIRPLFKRLLGPVEFAALQDKEAAGRYAGLGILQEKIYVCGNVKYDALSDKAAKLPQVRNLLETLGWHNHPVLVAGSTHPAEETMLLRAAPDLLKSGLKIIFAPRHLERRAEIERSLRQSHLRYAFLSEQKYDKHTDILCADVMGWLQSLYAAGTLCFVGGSVVPKGAHNLLEPAILGKTVLFGKYFFNTPDTARALLEQGGGVLVNEHNFKETVLRLLTDKQQLENMNEKALQTARSFQGATEKIMGVIQHYEQQRES